MFRVHGEVTPVGPDQECGRIVLALLEVRSRTVVATFAVATS